MSAFGKIQRFSVTTALRFLALGVALTLYGAVGKSGEPLALALAVATLPLGAKGWILPLCVAVSCLVNFSIRPFVYLFSGAGIAAACGYLPLSVRATYRLPAITLLSCLPYLFLAQTGSFLYRFVIIGGCAVLSLICHAGLRAVFTKGISAKRSTDESLGLSISVVILGIGACNLLGANAWKAVGIACVLLCASIEDQGVTMTAAVVLSLPLAVHTQSLTFCGILPVFAALCIGLSPISHTLSAACVPVADGVIGYFLGAYGTYGYSEFLYVFCSALVVGILPQKWLFRARERLQTIKERQLTRATVNRSRALLSGKLHEISGVFMEMQALFYSSCTSKNLPKIAPHGALEEICRACPHATRCPRLNETQTEKLLTIGTSKGKLTLVDLSADVCDQCKQPNHLLYGFNRLLSSSQEKLLERRSGDAGKELVATQAGAIADILRRFAADFGKTLRYQPTLERKCVRALAEKGFAATELMVYGELDGDIVISAIFSPLKNLTPLCETLSKVCGKTLTLEDKLHLTADKCYLCFSCKPRYDAAFGVAMATKDGSEASGDTHSLVRIDKNKFMVALCDGMGSGQDANSLSSSSLSLIESFYRAGMKSEDVFSTVNRIFTLDADDRFCAIDAATVSLTTGTVDFIKLGAPYGFIVTEGGIRLIEGSSLPLGILDELRPGICSAILHAGDTVLMLSDGITDAFPSSTDLLDFLASLPAKNPQSLADSVLEKALSFSDGKAKDDATVVAVRLFESEE